MKYFIFVKNRTILKILTTEVQEYDLNSIQLT